MTKADIHRAVQDWATTGKLIRLAGDPDDILEDDPTITTGKYVTTELAGFERMLEFDNYFGHDAAGTHELLVMFCGNLLPTG